MEIKKMENQETKETKEEVKEEIKQEIKKEEVKETKKEEVKDLYKFTNDSVAKVIKGTKIIAQEISTGTSYFQGKNRLCKVLKTKRGISLEINVILPKEVETEFTLEKISAAVAYRKHLGTMKYMAKLNDEKVLPKLLKSMVEEFKKLNQVAKEEVKEQKAQ